MSSSDSDDDALQYSEVGDEEWLWLLLEACDSDDLERVQRLVEPVDDAMFFNILDENGDSPLHRACRYGSTDVAKYLLTSDKLCLSATITGYADVTPLHEACEGGHRDTVEYLMESDEVQVNASAQNVWGQTPVYHACRRGRRDVVEYFLQSDRDDVDVNIPDEDGMTPLHIACVHGFKDVVECLVGSSRVHVMTEDKDRSNLLHYVCGGDPSDVLECLMQSSRVDVDANINKQNKHGGTPLHSACSRHDLRLVKYLMESDDIGVEVDANIQNRDGNTPLHSACTFPKLDHIQNLLQSHKICGSLHIQNKKGDTPLHMAFSAEVFATFNHTNRFANLFGLIQQQLIPTTRLSDLSHPNNRVKDAPIIQRLMDAAKPIANIQNRRGETLLHLACLSGKCNVSILRDLVGHDSVDATLQNSDGDTALHCICKAKGEGDNDCKVRVEKMKLLIESSNVKVDMNIKNKQGDTVLHCVAKHTRDYFELIEHLMSLEEMDPQVKNEAGKTALGCARNKRRRAKMAKLLELRSAGHASAKRGLGSDMTLQATRNKKRQR